MLAIHQCANSAAALVEAVKHYGANVVTAVESCWARRTSRKS